MFDTASHTIAASEYNPQNKHLQEVIEAFKIMYEEDERK